MIRTLAATLPLLLAALAAQAATVQLNADISPFSQGEIAATGRYRLSPTNWDQMLGTGVIGAPGTTLQTNNLGDATALNNRAWNFTLSHVAGTGYTFILEDTTVPPLAASPGTLTWTTPLGTPAVSPTRSFNAIELFAQAQNTLPSGTSSLSMQVRNLAFTGAGLTTAGSLVDFGDTHLLSPAGTGRDFALQWLVADTDLSLFNWTVTGQVQGTFGGTVPSNFGEQLKFDFKTVQMNPVPIPAALPLLLSGLAVVFGFGRRARPR